MKNANNSRTSDFLKTIPTTSIYDSNNDMAKRCKFNFSYFTKDANAGQDFQEWNHRNLYELLNKLKEYSKFELSYWENKRQGNHPTLVYYDSFPTGRTDFILPKHVPHQAVWSRFRLSGSSRLIGFVLPKEYNYKEQNENGFKFDSNTFYVVFLDKNHQFYKTR